MVSVIIPCYKQGHFLPEALASVQNQTFENWECIIINDGSPDNTADIAHAWVSKDKRFRYLSQPNCGLTRARNRGILEARGDYIQFLDADDLIEPLKLAWQTNLLQNRPDVGIIYSDLRYFTDNDHQHLRYTIFDPDEPWLEKSWLDPRPVLEKLLENNIMAVHCPLFRRAVIDAVGLFENDMRVMEDWFYLFRCAVKGAVFQYSPAPGTLALARIHANSVTQGKAHMIQGTYDMTLMMGPFLTDPCLRLKNFLLGMRRMTVSDRISVERELFRLFLANKGCNTVRPFLNAYLVRHPRLSKLLRYLI